MSDEGERSLTGILGDLGGHVDTLVRAKFRLARAEFMQEARRLARAAALLAVGCVIGSIALAFLALSLVYALSPSLSPFTAALLVGVISGAAAGVALTAGLNRFRGITLRKANARLHDHMQWARGFGR